MLVRSREEIFVSDLPFELNIIRPKDWAVLTSTYFNLNGAAWPNSARFAAAQLTSDKVFSADQ